MTEVTLVKRTVIVAGVVLVLFGAVACTREKPPVTEPTPTLVARGIAPFVPTTTVALPPTPTLFSDATIVPEETPTPASETPTPNPSGSGASTSYTIQWGDWLSKIASKFGVTSQAILAANPGLDPDKIYPGKVIVIPAAGSSVPPTESTPGPANSVPATYTVQRGDWFSAIARKFGVTVSALQAANPGVDPAVVYPGQVLSIPGGSKQNSTPIGGTGSSYVVKQGDTLSSIAVRFGKTVYALQIANNLSDASAIYPGQTLIIP